MSKIDFIYTDFSAGELSPLLKGRVTSDKYKSGVSILENFYCTPHGPVVRRGGTQYVADAKYSNKETRLLPFTVGANASFVLEVGDYYIRFFTDQGQLVHLGVDVSTLSIWVTATAYIVDDEIYNQDGSFYHTTYRCIQGHTSGATDEPGVGANWADYWEIILECTAPEWQTAIVYTLDDFVDKDNGNVYHCIQGHTSGATDEPGVGANWADYWVLQTEYEITTQYSEDEVFDLVYTQSADVLYLAHKDHAPATLSRLDTYDWDLSDISFTAQPAEWAANNYPTVVGLYEQRLIWAATPDQPQTLWGSKSAEYANLTIGTGDADAFKYTVASDKVNIIEWLSSGEVLLIGTAGAEFKCSANSLNEALTPTNVNIRRQTNLGSRSSLPAIKIGERTLYVQRGGKRVRDLVYKFETSSYTSQDTTILSEHITGGKGTSIIDVGYCNQPSSIYWAVRSDGELIGLVYEPNQQVTGWFRYVIAGVDAKVKSVSCSENASNPANDDVWLIVDRIIDGSTVKYIEFIKPSLVPEEDLEDAFYVDSGLSYDESTPTTVFTNLDHLEGETVQVLADGATHGDLVVSGGQVTLDREASKVHIGLGFESRLRTLNLEGGNPAGTAQAKTQRINTVHIRVYRSLNLLVGDTEFDRYEFGPGEMDEAVEVVSEDVEVPFTGDFGTTSEIEVKQDQPLPLTIIAIIAEARIK